MLILVPLVWLSKVGRGWKAQGMATGLGSPKSLLYFWKSGNESCTL